MSKWIRFNDNQTNDGVEGRYRLSGGVLQIVVFGTNSKKDLFDNFSWCTVFRGYNPHYMVNAMWLNVFVRRVQAKHNAHRVELHGHSKAGAVCQLLKKYLMPHDRVSVVTYGGVKACWSPPVAMHYVNKGDLIPLWFPLFGRSGSVKRLGPWRNPVSAHNPKNYRIPR